MASVKAKSPALTEQVDIPSKLPEEVGENAWIDVIQKMDAIYADLVQHQIQLEDKNNKLEETYLELRKTHEELQRTQQQLVQSEKMASLGRLVAGVAHELNNPISFIIGNTHAMERYSKRLQTFFSELGGVSNPSITALRNELRIDRLLSDLDPLVEGTKEGAQRVERIVDSLLRFTTPQQKQTESFDLSKLIRTTVEWVTRSSNAEPQVNFSMPERFKLISFEVLIHQILVNLVHNAVDACEQQKEPALWICLTRENNSVVISIRDNGTGIKRENLANIFDPFFTTKQPGKGTGLGLYISYLLATEQCDGQLSAENHASGGALFKLTLPDLVNEEII